METGANRIALAAPVPNGHSGNTDPGVNAYASSNQPGTSNSMIPLLATGSSVMAQPSNRLHSRAIANHHHQRVQSSSSLHSTPVTPITTLTVFSSAPSNESVILIPTTSDQAFTGKVPKHSLPHPSQNPHPAALSDNASMLTLASSGFAPSIHAMQK